MISDELKCIYIHIPKTGGMSIETMLGMDVKKVHQQAMKIKHGTPKEWKYPDYWETYYKFTFVRNPWDRVVSSYFFNLKMANKNIKQHDRGKINNYGEEGFNDYVINNLKHSKSRHFLPYTHWISGYTYDFIGKLENFENDMKSVCKDIKIKFKNVHINKSNRKKYQEYYNKESRDVIEKIYRKDIARFDYSF